MDDLTGNPLPEVPKQKVVIGNVPKSDLDLVTTAKAAVEKWKSIPAITLLWTTSSAMEQKVNSYEQLLNERISTGSRRPEITEKLKKLDKEINSGAGFIKNYLKELYGSEDKSHYSQYGIMKTGSMYKIPVDRDNRVSSISLILEALERDGLNDKTYGKAFWQYIQSQYLPLKQEAATMDESVAGKVSSKNQLRDEIVKHLYALINVIKANYPDTYKSEMRVWGFQKEKY